MAIRDEALAKDEAIISPETSGFYWLIFRDDDRQSQDSLTISYGGEEVLPVFSFEEEAEMFLSFGGLKAGWRTRKVGRLDLLSILLRSAADVDYVALDPLPEMISRETIGLVQLPCDQFAQNLIKRRQTTAL